MRIIGANSHIDQFKCKGPSKSTKQTLKLNKIKKPLVKANTILHFVHPLSALVVELVDTQPWGGCAPKGVKVRVLSSAPIFLRNNSVRDYSFSSHSSLSVSFSQNRLADVSGMRVSKTTNHGNVRWRTTYFSIEKKFN